ncbi:MAG: T9SS C-terminal target domain-containing protein [Calditrichaeota bacterium]|nr:MAG: T9SS C-terminal target domain-containing protein [Calditrichota bacterium]
MKKLITLLLTLAFASFSFAQGFNLTEPINSDTVEVFALDFDWSSAPSGSFSGQVYYHIEAGADSTFTLPSIVDVDSLTSSSHSVDMLTFITDFLSLFDSLSVQQKNNDKISANDTFAADMYWRVTAWDSSGFTMPANNNFEHFVFSPGSFNLNTPTDSTFYQVNPNSITFNWDKPSGVSTFSILTYTLFVTSVQSAIAQGPTIVGPVIGSTLSSTHTETVGVDSLPDGLYIWGVLASVTSLSGTELHLSKQLNTFIIGDIFSDVEEIATLKPEDFVLRQNYPNPFNPSTTISYSLPQGNNLGQLTIFNLLGQEIQSFNLQSQNGSVVWNGLSANGKQVSSGVYFYQLKSENGVSNVKKMTLIK